MGTERHTVLYDDRCRFCMRCVRWLLLGDKQRRMRSMPIESPEGDRLLAGMRQAQRLESWHLVAPDGQVFSGGAAAPVALRLLPRGKRVAALLERFPRATDRAYRWVADHRVLLSRLTRSRCAGC